MICTEGHEGKDCGIDGGIDINERLLSKLWGTSKGMYMYITHVLCIHILTLKPEWVLVKIIFVKI